MGIWLIILLLFLAVYRLVSIYLDKKIADNPFGLKNATLVYIDDKHAKTLVSHKYKICAKPDFIYQDKRGEILVERKMAKRKPILADIVQVKASIICARTKYKKVTRAVISTGSGNYHYIFNQSTNELFEDILMYHKICQAIYRGIERNDTWKTISNSIK